jgi:hypothetical protein
MSGRAHGNEDVLWSWEGDAWVGVPRGERPDGDAGTAGHDGYEVEVLLRAEDCQVEVSHAPSGEFARKHVQAADEDEAKARAADLLSAFRARSTG